MSPSYRVARSFGLFALLALVLATPQSHANDEVASLQKVLDNHLDSQSRVSYAALKAQPDALENTLRAIAKADVSKMSTNARKAFYINAYNAYTLHLMVTEWPVKSILDLDGGKVWDTRKHTVAGAQLTLNEIEHQTLRKLNDPRIHAGVNCASKGCPPLFAEAFRSSDVSEQLEQSTFQWIQSNAFTVEGATKRPTTVRLNAIFEWYGDDFLPKYGAAHFDVPGVEGKEEAAINFIVQILTHNGHKAGLAAALRRGGYAVAWQDYNWQNNGQ
jgi:hypothetical protein